MSTSSPVPVDLADDEEGVKDGSSDVEVLRDMTGDSSALGSQESVPLMQAPTRSSAFGECPSSAESRCCTPQRVKQWLWTNLLLLLTVVSVLVGIVVGISVREVDMEPGSKGYVLMVELLGFPGELFLRMLKMLILPLIVFSLLSGLGSLETKVAGSLGWKTLLYYSCTTLLAVVLGLLLVSTIKPGSRGRVREGLQCDNSTTHRLENQLEVIDTILDLIRNMFPDNLFVATFQQSETKYEDKNVTNFDECLDLYGLDRCHLNLTSSTMTDIFSNREEEEENCTHCPDIQRFFAESNLSCANATREQRSLRLVGREGMNVLGIIVFTVAFGVVLARLGDQATPIVRAVGVLNTAIMKLVAVVMWYSPIGIASIVAGKLAEVPDFKALFQEIGMYSLTVLVGLFIHACIVLPLIYTIATRRNPLKVVTAVPQALFMAFATSSSSATLPFTIQNLEANFGADPRVTRFMLPVGATINMDGTALYEAVAAVFISQVQDQDLSVVQLIVVSITATCASVGAAGVPQAGLFTLLIVLVAVGLDPQNVAIILTVDWLLDRFRTTVNVLGDSFGVGVVGHLTRKQLGRFPKPLLQQQQPLTQDSPSRDYGTSSSPPPSTPSSPTPKLFEASTPEWSESSLESGRPSSATATTAAAAVAAVAAIVSAGGADGGGGVGGKDRATGAELADKSGSRGAGGEGSVSSKKHIEHIVTRNL